jgi:hypothetical protein
MFTTRERKSFAIAMAMTGSINRLSPSFQCFIHYIFQGYFLFVSPMVCRNVCEKIYSKIIVGQSHYLVGKKYCRRCERYLIIDKVFCPCCGMQLRTTPNEGSYKQKLRKEKRKLYYNSILKNDMAKATCLIDIKGTANNT